MTIKLLQEFLMKWLALYSIFRRISFQLIIKSKILYQKSIIPFSNQCRFLALILCIIVRIILYRNTRTDKMVLGLWQQQIAFRGKSNNKEAKYYIITMIYKYYKTSFLCRNIFFLLVLTIFFP